MVTCFEIEAGLYRIPVNIIVKQPIRKLNSSPVMQYLKVECPK